MKDTLARTLQQTKDQLEACKEAKHRLEMDWSDKYSAQNLGIILISGFLFLHRMNLRFKERELEEYSWKHSA